MNQYKDGRIILPVDFNNKNRLVTLTFYTMDDGTFNFKVGKKTIAISDSGQVAAIVNDMGTKAMEALTELMENAKVGSAFTVICQIRENPRAVIPGLGFIDQEIPGNYYGEQTYWEKLLNSWFLAFNIDNTTSRRYKSNKEGFLNLKRDIQTNAINVDKNVVESMFGNPSFDMQSPFIVEPDDDIPPAGGKVKVEHPEENRTKLS